MGKSLRFGAFLCLSVMALGLLCGCISKSASELYALPQLDAENQLLGKAVGKILDSGAEYSAPVSGSNRQAVQMEDLDGDGEKEAIAFFSVAGEEKPLKVCIFEETEETFTPVATIEGQGTEIESVEYTDMNKDGTKEVVLGWQVSSELKLLEVYDLQDYQPSLVASTDYTRYTLCALSGSSGRELGVLRVSASDQSATLELYTLMSDGDMVTSTARLSLGVESVSSLRSGYLGDGTPAIFTDSVLSDYTVTDIFVYKRGNLTNITANEVSGISEETLRTYNTPCRDIDSDGAVEVPRPIPLPVTAQDASTYWIIQWNSYDYRGEYQLDMSTYHNYTDSWYLRLPDDWLGNISLRREAGSSGERSVVFTRLDKESGENVDFLEVYTLSGDNREDRARLPGRFILLQEGETIYAARILAGAGQCGLTISENLVRQNFSIIYSEWIAG